MSDWDIETLRMQKRARFQMILEWEQKRSADSDKYKTILHTLASRVMQKATISRDANRAVIKFLHEKALGYKVYSEVLLAELTYLPDPEVDPIIVDSDAELHSKEADLDFHEKDKSLSLKSGMGSVSTYQTALSTSFTSASFKIQ